MTNYAKNTKINNKINDLESHLESEVSYVIRSYPCDYMRGYDEVHTSEEVEEATINSEFVLQDEEGICYYINIVDGKVECDNEEMREMVEYMLPEIA